MKKCKCKFVKIKLFLNIFLFTLLLKESDQIFLNYIYLKEKELLMNKKYEVNPESVSFRCPLHQKMEAILKIRPILEKLLFSFDKLKENQLLSQHQLGQNGQGLIVLKGPSTNNRYLGLYLYDHCSQEQFDD